MFCPQCRDSWPSGAIKGDVAVDKPKSSDSKPAQWGKAALCPNCLVPLAADRIQGEFPSVAHASSAKEGSMTIKDVLRETEGNGITQGVVPLDDKKPEPKPSIFGLDSKGRNVFVRTWDNARTGPPSIFHRIAIIMFAICIGSLVFLMFSSVGTVSKPAIVTGGNRSANNFATERNSGASPAEQDLLKSMPAAVGDWTRIETNGQIWNDNNVGNGAVMTYVSSYKSGKSRVYLWAVKAPVIQDESPLANFEGTPRAVHDDNGVTVITPSITDVGGTDYSVFDYVPSHATDSYMIVTNQTFAPALAHTISWYSSPYILTVASNSASDRDKFFKVLASHS